MADGGGGAGAHFAAMVNSTRDLMTLIDQDYVYLEVNQAYLEARGLSREQVVGRTVSDLWGTSVLDSVVGDSLRRALRGEPVRYRALFELAPGEGRSMEVSFDPVREPDGKIRSVVVTSRDLTSERRLITDLLGRLDEEPQTARAVPRPGSPSPTFRPAGLLDELVLAASREGAARGLLVLLEASTDLPERVTGDRRCWRELLRALLKRAIERSQQGRVALYASRHDNHHLSFAVQDSGTRPEVGSDLDEVRGTVRRLGGELEIRDDGALVRLVLPAEPTTPSSELEAEPGSGSPRVLVVDDHAVNREVARQLLAARGLAATLAPSGEVALGLLARETFDLVLLDWRMPGVDGLAVARSRRAHEAATGAARTVMVALTASAVAGDREQCLAAGLDDYLVKPLRPAELDRVLARWLPGGWHPRPAVDEETLATLDDPRDPSFLVELVDLFLEDATPRLLALREGAARGDGKAARDAAHALKGAAANLGATGLVELCERLEDEVRVSSRPLSAFDLDAHTAAIEGELGRTSAALRASVASRR